MSRKVKCYWTKEEGRDDEFYEAKNGRFFKTEEVYNEYVVEMEYHKEVVDMFSRLLGYYDSGQFNKQAMKELQELKKTYSYADIFDTFKEFYCKLDIVMKTKTQLNDFLKAKYIFAVIKNNINDVCNKNIRLEKAKKLIDEKEIDIDIMNDSKTNNSKIKDISEFLDY